MKKSQLRNIIKESIKKLMNEEVSCKEAAQAGFEDCDNNHTAGTSGFDNCVQGVFADYSACKKASGGSINFDDYFTTFSHMDMDMGTGYRKPPKFDPRDPDGQHRIHENVGDPCSQSNNVGAQHGQNHVDCGGNGLTCNGLGECERMGGGMIDGGDHTWVKGRPGDSALGQDHGGPSGAKPTGGTITIPLCCLWSRKCCKDNGGIDWPWSPQDTEDLIKNKIW